MQDVRVRREVTQPSERRDRKIGRRDFVRKALADQSGELPWMIERVDARHDAAGAVSEHEHGQPRLTRCGQRHNGLDIADIIRELLDVEALAVGPAAAAQIARIDGDAVGHELFRHPRVVRAVRVEAVDGDDDTAWRCGRTPRSDEQPEAARAVHCFFTHRTGCCLRHGNLLASGERRPRARRSFMIPRAHDGRTRWRSIPRQPPRPLS